MSSLCLLSFQTALTTGGPRLTRDTQEVTKTPEINLANVTSLSFRLESNPPPATFAFRALATRGDGQPADQPLGPNVFRVICSKTAVTSRHACVISVVSVPEAEEGVYGLDIGNGVGQMRLRFRVSRDSEYNNVCLP